MDTDVDVMNMTHHYMPRFSLIRCGDNVKFNGSFTP